MNQLRLRFHVGSLAPTIAEYAKAAGYEAEAERSHIVVSVAGAVKERKSDVAGVFLKALKASCGTTFGILPEDAR